MSDLRVEWTGHIATVEICRPPTNYFDVGLLGELADQFESLGEHGCRSIVLCSRGKHFCAGADLRTPPPTSEVHLYDEALRIFRQPVPVVAAVQGAAVGGGFGLALAADFRVATKSSIFHANFARLGIHHGFGMTVTLAHAVGPTRALEMLSTARRVGGEEALAIGLVESLAEPDRLRAEALRLAESIAGSAPLAVSSIRETMRGPLVEAVHVAIQRERSEQERLVLTADFHEGVLATAEQRTPHFVGNAHNGVDGHDD